jgi:hypothetical protein
MRGCVSEAAYAARVQHARTHHASGRESVSRQRRAAHVSPLTLQGKHVPLVSL